ncbi:two-component sensor histidine kinase [Actinomadura sp. NBRC 104412]|nr:two-component sensor histidine kinase [Actinomadura sp. NBRC 104412]
MTVALGLGGVLSLRATDRAATSSVEDLVHRRARTVAAWVMAVGIKGVSWAPYGYQMTQVMAADGRTVVASAGMEGPAMLDAEQIGLAKEHKTVFTIRLADGTEAAAGGVGINLDGKPLTVLVAVPLEDRLRSYETTRQILLVGLPMLVVLFGGVVWVVTGSALRPVAALRQAAQDMADSAQGRRLPVPDARDEIHDLAVTLNGMLDRLAEAALRQRSFTADAAHELRSPLASARAQLEVALTYPSGVDWVETARGISADMERLTRLSEDLLALARLDGMTGRPDPGGPADLGVLAGTIAERFHAARVPVNVVVQDARDRPCAVLAAAAPHDVDRVLTNLVANATRHAAGAVVIAVAAVDGEAVLTVTDDGPGIPAQDRERVLERFTRLDDARDTDAGGAGLGLAIVAETVRHYLGTLTLEDADPGLRVSVRLPSATEDY